MALRKTEYESSVSAEKMCTKYTWILEDWMLLYDIHYAEGVQSQNFILNGTEGVSCKLYVAPMFPTDDGAYIKIDFSDKLKFLSMVLTISSINERGAKSCIFTKTYEECIRESIEVDVETHFPKSRKYLKNGDLVLLTEVTIINSVITSSIPDEVRPENFGVTPKENFEAIFNSKSFYDVTFVIGDEKFFAHKIILAAKSEVFKAIFLSVLEEEEDNKITITDVEAKAFVEFLSYIYVKKINNLEAVAHEIIMVADKYQVYDLKATCENYMLASIDTKNVVQYLLIAERLSCLALKNKALDLIKRNIRALAYETNYKLLSDYPKLIKEVFGK